MKKLIIYLDGNPAVQGYSRLEFKWSQPHNAYLWEGRELEEREFNAEFEKMSKLAVQRYLPLRWLIKVKILDSVGAAAPAPVVPPAPSPAAPPPAPAAKSEPTLAEALEIVEALAPHRLKKKTGPRAEPVAA